MNCTKHKTVTRQEFFIFLIRHTEQLKRKARFAYRIPFMKIIIWPSKSASPRIQSYWHGDTDNAVAAHKQVRCIP